jgi:vacuolar-type H+-ATPase subunit H
MPLTDAEYRLMNVGVSDYHDRVFHEHAAEDMIELLEIARGALLDLAAAEADAEKTAKDLEQEKRDAVLAAEEEAKEKIADLETQLDDACTEHDKESRDAAAKLAAAEHAATNFEEGARLVLVALCSRATLQPEINASHAPIMALLFVQALGVLIEIVAWSREEQARLDVRREQMRKEHVVRLARESKPVLIFRAAALGMSDVESSGYTKQQLAEIIAARWTQQARAAGGLAYWQYGTENMKISRG